MTPEIEKNIPVPITITARMRLMALNDSFEHDYSDPKTPYKQAKRAGITVRTYKQTNGLIRVWRIA